MASFSCSSGLLVVLVLISLSCSCIAGATTAASLASAPFVVKGRVYCDACGAGFFTKSSRYMAGAHVVVECTSKGGAKTLKAEGVTNTDGVFQIEVAGGHEEDSCTTGVLRSESNACSSFSTKTFTSVYLTRNNGIANNIVNTGPFSFRPDQVASSCAQEVAQEVANMN